VGGLPWLNPTDVCGVKPEERKKIKNKKIKNFLLSVGRKRPRGAPQGRLRRMKKKKKKVFYFYFFLLGTGGLAVLREVALW
jgi:hypothetical protein